MIQWMSILRTIWVLFFRFFFTSFIIIKLRYHKTILTTLNIYIILKVLSQKIKIGSKLIFYYFYIEPLCSSLYSLEKLANRIARITSHDNTWNWIQFLSRHWICFLSPRIWTKSIHFGSPSLIPNVYSPLFLRLLGYLN